MEMEMFKVIITNDHSNQVEWSSNPMTHSEAESLVRKMRGHKILSYIATSEEWKPGDLILAWITPIRKNEQNHWYATSMSIATKRKRTVRLPWADLFPDDYTQITWKPHDWGDRVY